VGDSGLIEITHFIIGITLNLNVNGDYTALKNASQSA